MQILMIFFFKKISLWIAEVSTRKQTLIATKIKMNLCVNRIRVRGSLSRKYESKCKRSATERHTKKCSSFPYTLEMNAIENELYRMQIQLISRHIHIVWPFCSIRIFLFLLLLCVFHFNGMQLSYTWNHTINPRFSLQ